MKDRCFMVVRMMVAIERKVGRIRQPGIQTPDLARMTRGWQPECDGQVSEGTGLGVLLFMRNGSRLSEIPNLLYHKHQQVSHRQCEQYDSEQPPVI